MATQVTLGSGVVDSAAGLKLRTNGSTEAVDISTAQVVTLAKDAVVNGLTVGKGAGAISTNTAVGASALAANTTGYQNTTVGSQAGATLTDGYRNTFIGRQSGYLTTSGYQNIGVGESSLYNNTTGSSNSALGRAAMASNTTGSYNIAVGQDALQANTTASNNTAVGYQALYSNTTAGNNTAVGYKAGYSATLSQNNLFIGYNAGLNHNLSVLGAGYNCFVGDEAGVGVTTGVHNTLVGTGSGYGLTTGSYNTFVGANNASNFGAGELVTTGSKNTILGGFSGNQGGLNITTSNNYIVLSDGDGNPRMYCDGNGAWTIRPTALSGIQDGLTMYDSGSGTGEGLRIKWQSADYASVAHIYGDSANGCYIQAGGANGVRLAYSATSWTAVSDERKKDIIEPITDAANKVLTLRAVIGKYKSDDEGVRRSFLIAQDVQAVLPEAITEEHDGTLGLQYTDVIPLLVAAIKELKAEIDTLKGQA